VRVIMYIHGVAELPLHNGHVPPHLLELMKRLGRAIAMYIVDVFGSIELVKRLSDPLWFQAFNNVIGMDWDSSGSTTVVLYVLKSFANIDTFGDIGLAVVGGKGVDARNCVKEIEYLDRFDLDVDYLRYVSRLSAKIDSVALQDGYTLYIHSLVLSREGAWTVIQQGMDVSKRMARRYHIHANNISSDINPHSGIACNMKSNVINLMDRESYSTKKLILDLLDENPKKILNYIATVNRLLRKDASLEQWTSNRSTDIEFSGESKKVDYLKNVNPILYRPITNIKRIEDVLNHVVKTFTENFDSLLLHVGPEFIRALVLVADLIYGEVPSFRDPVTHAIDPFAYSFAHGGKDGIPFPVKFDIMRNTIQFLEDAINSSKLDGKLKRKALENLYHYWRKIERATLNKD